MILPAAMPRGFWAYASPVLIEAGVAGLVGGFLAGGRGLAISAALAVAGICGFLSQIIVGVEGRVLSLFAWLWGFADRGYAESPPSLHRASARSLQGLGFVLWTADVPLLARGLAADRTVVISLGAGTLLVAVLAGLANAIGVLARLWRGGARPRRPQ
jgi:hypothetical protein